MRRWSINGTVHPTPLFFASEKNSTIFTTNIPMGANTYETKTGKKTLAVQVYTPTTSTMDMYTSNPFLTFPLGFLFQLDEPRESFPFSINFLSAVLIHLWMSLPSLSGPLCCRFLPYIHHPTWRYGRDDVPHAQNLNKVNQPLAELTNHQHLLPYPLILCSNKHLKLCALCDYKSVRTQCPLLLLCSRLQPSFSASWASFSMPCASNAAAWR